MPYYDVLMDFPFKGDEMPLLAMEHAELISIATSNGGRASSYATLADAKPHPLGRPSTIRPGKPVLKYVFQRLVDGGSMSSP